MRQVGSQHLVKNGANIKVECIHQLCLCAGPKASLHTMILVCSMVSQNGFKPAITFQHFGLVEAVIIERQRQSKNMHSANVANQVRPIGLG